MGNGLDWISLISKTIEDHFKKILVVFIFLVIGAGSFLYMESLKSKREYRSFNDLSKIINTYKKKKENFEKSLNSKDKKLVDKSDNGKTKQKGKAGENLYPPTGNLNQDYGDEVTSLKEFIERNQGSSASVEAALILSEILF